MIEQKTYWKIKDAEGNIVNTIVADEHFVEENFEHYELVVLPVSEQKAREWRDEQLAATDDLARIPDYPNSAILLEYRQALRDWPNTDDFPEKFPESLESRIENS